MKDEELSNTKPINKISDVPLLEKEGKIPSREEKYKDAVLEEENKEAMEAAEEALAEKNIAEAESLLEQEAEALEDVDSSSIMEKESDEKGKKGIPGLIDKWKKLDKNKKIIYGIIAFLVLLMVVLFIVALILIFSGKKKEDSNGNTTPTESIAEQAPDILSNYYYKDGVLHFVDDNEKELGEYECENQDDKLCYVAINSYRDSFDVPKLLNSKGEEIKRVLPIFEDNYVFIFDNKSADDKNITLYSISESTKVNTYLSVKAFSDNYVIVENTSNKFGLIQFKDGLQEIIKEQYTYLGMIDGESNLVAKSSKGYMIINKNNKIQSKTIPANDQIKYYNDHLIVTISSKSYTLYNYEGELLTDNHSFISINGNYAALVDDARVKVIDSDGTKYNEDGVALKNKDYVKTFIYDEDDNLSETKRSYTLEDRSNDIAVVVYNGDEDNYTYLDKTTPKINAKYQHVNYFDGKLYFYKDAEKKELAGSYSCGMKNEVSGSSASFNQCFIASDTVYENNDMQDANDVNRSAFTPIINGRYVFIKDADSIYLYDIEQRKTLSTYNSVNTYTSSNSDITSYNGEKNVVALNKKGLYGVIRISGSSVSPVYSFTYNKIEKVGDVYIAYNTNNKWVVLSLDSSVEYNEKIVGHNKSKSYFKTKESSYHVYDEYGNKVSKDDYAYVELYDDYYAAVTNKEVYIYDYDGNRLTDKGIKIVSTSYCKTENPSFYVVRRSGIYYVYVYENNQYSEYSTISQTGSSGEH